MTISEAMKLSQQTGQAFQRDSNEGYAGWIRYWEDWSYSDLSASDLMADDWEMIVVAQENK